MDYETYLADLTKMLAFYGVIIDLELLNDVALFAYELDLSLNDAYGLYTDVEQGFSIEEALDAYL